VIRFACPRQARPTGAAISTRATLPTNGAKSGGAASIPFCGGTFGFGLKARGALGPLVLGLLGAAGNAEDLCDPRAVAFLLGHRQVSLYTTNYQGEPLAVVGESQRAASLWPH
jgi:hypothetical protein